MTKRQHRALQAKLRTLDAVRAGRVSQRFDRDGNVFTCPANISARMCRLLQDDGFIEDVPGQRGAVFLQQLTPKGRDQLRVQI